MIDDGIRQLLVTTPAITALIGTRMYPLVLPPQCVFPAVTYRLVSDIEENTLADGAVSSKARLQLDIYADNLLASKTVAKAIGTVLKDFTGALPNAVNVANAWRDNQSTGFDQDARKDYVQADWMVIHDDV